MREDMMSRLAEIVKEDIGTECTVHFRKIEKNNGVVLQAVEIIDPKMKVKPLIYIDGLIKRVEAGEIGLQDAARGIVDIYMNAKDSCDMDFREVTFGISKEYILENVVYQVINFDKNAGRLADMPHKKLLDLAAIYRVVVNGANGNASFAIWQTLCDAFAITEEELDAAARRNTERAGFCVKSMEAICAEILGIPEESSEPVLNIWVITNPSKINGAAVMLYNRCFDSLAEKMESDLYVLPSSIHEVIAVPTKDMNPDELRDMVHSVNTGEVSDDEILGYNVYRYSRKDSTLVIV